LAGRAPARRKGTAGGGFVGGLKKAAGVGGLISLGLSGGYLCRSYFPLPLPFESKLVADRSSQDLSSDSLKNLAKAATTRAENAERQRDELQRQMADIETRQQDTERQLADLKVKSVLGQ